MSKAVFGLPEHFETMTCAGVREPSIRHHKPGISFSLQDKIIYMESYSILIVRGSRNTHQENPRRTG
jgi:hypothetical protein